MKYILSALIIALIGSSCSDKETDPPPPSNTQHITASPWKYESGGVDQDRNGTVDITFESTGLVQACVLDNSGTFNANGTGVNDEGATKCNGNLPQTTPFTWSFANNETSLNVGGSGVFGIGGQFKITTLTSTKMTLSKDTTIMATTVGLIVNLKH